LLKNADMPYDKEALAAAEVRDDVARNATTKHALA
jgi:hypothetical protein